MNKKNRLFKVKNNSIWGGAERTNFVSANHKFIKEGGKIS